MLGLLILLGGIAIIWGTAALGSPMIGEWMWLSLNGDFMCFVVGWMAEPRLLVKFIFVWFLVAVWFVAWFIVRACL